MRGICISIDDLIIVIFALSNAVDVHIKRIITHNHLINAVIQSMNYIIYYMC
jgi:hypothetical protein